MPNIVLAKKVRLGFSVTSTNQLYFIIWLYHGLLDGSQMSMEEHLGYFQLLEFMNKSVKYLWSGFCVNMFLFL